MPLQATSGAASYDAFGGGVAAVPNYIEDIFSCFLYTGNSSTQTITNGIDLSGKGGLVWTKSRSTATDHALVDTVRGADKVLHSESTAAQVTYADITSFNSTGYSLDSVSGWFNTSSRTYASWTLRKQPKFFDVVTYTGDNTASKAISHNLGSVPGCVIVKRTDSGSHWFVWHRSTSGTPNNDYTLLNQTAATAVATNAWSSNAFTSTEFYVSNNLSTNVSGATYVAYLFAHDAGGFGLTGTDNVISCGSFSGNTTVTLGYEPQWIMLKRTDAVGNWDMHDVMRGWPVSGDAARLRANLSDAESQTSQIYPNATGFSTLIGAGNYIYIAIRRGPMKVPTSGTSVFAPSTGVEPSSSPLFTAGFSDMTLHKGRIQSTYSPLITDRLRGKSIALYTSNTNADSNLDPYFQYDSNAGAFIPAGGYFNNAGGGSDPYALYAFRRAPSFFDEVCYTGTGSDTTQTHNLGVAPELVIIKSRSNAIVWVVGNTTIGFANYLLLNTTDASASGSNVFNSTAPTSTVFSIGAGSGTNQSGATYVAYLFATLAGVSKVGSYTGNGSSQTINCGFTGGARFVLIKKSSGTGDWMVSDSARGIVSGNDPYLELNNTNAEVTGEDWLDTDSTGFVVNEVSGSNANTNGATYIFLAIA